MKSLLRQLFAFAGGALLPLVAADWQPIAVPGSWEVNGPAAARTYDGVAWYRTWAKVPDKFFSRHTRNLWEDSVSVNVRDIANAHETFVNGLKIGEGVRFARDAPNGPSVVHRHKVPVGTLRAGEWNEIAIRVTNHAGPGGFLGDAPFIMTYDTEGVLEGTWEFLLGDDYRPGPARTGRPAESGFDQFRESTRVLGRSAQLVTGPKFSPGESLAKMRSAADLAVDLLLSEPHVAQPTHLSFDERGRLWVSQYRQYPYPAGLTMMSRSPAYESVYDRIPPAPPNHDRGADRISIHEDTDGDGVFDRHTVFQDGLNMANAAVRGRGGVWVMHTPYLLFYPDADFDDVPDGPPIVHLQGFGLEDTHAVANGLVWGPDGWLYGAQGSTTNSRVTRPGLDPPDAKGVYFESSMVWRYHPETRAYEIFAKGGGNTFGLEFDSHGRLYGGHNGGQTHGWHFMPGGLHLIRQPAMRPTYAFGELPSMKPFAPVRRFTHFGAFVAGTAMPARYRGHLFALDPLSSAVLDVEQSPLGASFMTKDVGRAMWSDDVAFRPLHIVNAPDGSLFVSDMYEYYIAHGQHYQSQIDPSTGRVYRLRGKHAPLERDTNLQVKSVPELVSLLTHPNQWHRHTAVRLLGERRDASATTRLLRLLGNDADLGALNALWALHQSGALDFVTLQRALRHTYAPVRMWAVRLLGERYGADPDTPGTDARSIRERALPPELSSALRTLAQSEPNAEVRSHVATMARRLTAGDALPLIPDLVRRDDDAKDPYIPLLLWWALEAQLRTNRAAVLQTMSAPELWDRLLVREQLLPRLMRRFAVEGTVEAFGVCVQLLRMAPTPRHTAPLIQGFEEAYRGRELTGVPRELLDAIEATGHSPLVLRVRRSEPAAVEEALSVVRDRRRKMEERLLYVRVFGEIRQAKATPVLLAIGTAGEPLLLRKAALAALSGFDHPEIATALIPKLQGATGEFRTALLTLLSSRAAWSELMLQAVEAGRVTTAGITAELADQIRAHNNRAVSELATRLLPRPSAPASADSRERVEALQTTIRAGAGNARAGEALFVQSCASCHTLFGRGGQLGPDLTNYQRHDLGTLLFSIIHPHAEIREGFEYHMIATHDGRSLGGFLLRQDQQLVVLRSLTGEDLSLSRTEIKGIERVARSLMPEGLLDSSNEQQVRDLFAYLQLTSPPATKSSATR